jgi:hypothetical protein
MRSPFPLPARLSGVALALLAACGPALAGELQTLAGKKIVGELVAADDKAVVLKTATGETTVPLTDVLLLDLQNAFAAIPANATWTEVELVDGSVFRGKALSIKGKEVEITLLNDGVVKVPLSTLASVLNDAQDPKVRADWAAVTAKKSRQDRVITKGEGGFDALEGAFGEGAANGQRIAFTTAGGARSNPKIADQAGLLFQQRLEGSIAPTLCKVTDSLRNLLVATKHAAGPKGVTVTLVCGAEIEYPAIADVVKLDYSKGKMQFLSDLTAELASEDKDSPAEYFRDQGPEKGLPLKLKGKEFRGLNLPVHPGRLSLTYDIGGDYKEFKALVGVDDSVEFDSEARLTIEVDGKEVYAAEVRRREEPKPVNLDVRNAKQLRINVVTDRLGVAQWVTLGDAKVSK